MKDFIKWLGVNEKVAKVAVWLMIIMICLIIVNTCFESIGLPYYAITYDNLINIKSAKVINVLVDFIISLLNFLVIVLLVVNAKKVKSLLKYGIVYLILNFIIYKLFGYIAMQVFIITYCIGACYHLSENNRKYILYGIIAIIINALIQTITYRYKASLIDYDELSRVSQAILSIDYFIIMAIIILVKEIYLKRRSKKCQKVQEAYFGGENSKKKENLQKKSQKK